MKLRTSIRLIVAFIVGLFLASDAAVARANVVTLYLPPTFIQSKSVLVSSATTSTSIAFNSTPTNGDLMLCAFSFTTSGDIGPLGWTRYQSVSNEGITLSIYYRFKQSSDSSGPYAFSVASASRLHIGCADYANVDPVYSFGQSTSTIGSSGTPITATLSGIASQISGSLPILFAAAVGQAGASQSGWTTDWNANTLGLSGYGEHYASLIPNLSSIAPALTYGNAPSAYVALGLLLQPKTPPNNIAIASTGNPAKTPPHAPTIAYIAGQYGYQTSSAIAQQYVDVVRTDIGSHALPPNVGNALCPIGTACTPYAYADTNSVYCTNDTIDWFNQANTPANEGWFLHTTSPISSSNRANSVGGAGLCPNQTGNIAYYPNPGNTASIAAWVVRYGNRIATPTGQAAANQGFFADDNRYYCAFGAVYEWGCPSSGSNSSAIQAMRQAEALSIAAVAPSLVWCNGLGSGGGFYGTGNPSPGGAINYTINTADLYTPANLVGCVHEGLMNGYASSAVSTNNIRIALNTDSQILGNTSKALAVLDYAFNVDGTTSDQVRRLHTAFLWLVAGRQQARVFSWLASYTPTTNFVAVTPEQQIYVKNPLTRFRAYVYNNAGSGSPELPFGNGTGCRNGSPSGQHAIDTLDLGGVDDVIVACPSGASGSGNGTDTGGNPAGVYAREYNDCYYASTRFGPCAAVINTTVQPVVISSSWFAYNYTHAIGWTGGALAGIGCPTYCNGVINLTASSVTLNTTTVPASDAVLLAP